MLPRLRAVAGLVVAFAVARPVPTRADERAVPTALDESTFLKRVNERSPRRSVLEERRHAAATQVAVARVMANPTLSYQREDVQAIETIDTYVLLAWPLDLTGRRRLAGNAARAGAEAERADVTREALLFEIDARLAYLEAVYTRERVARLDAARATLANAVATLQSRARQGDASSYDAERATLELDILDDERATALRELDLARLRLGALMGEPGTAYDASGTLVLPTRPQPTAALAPKRADVDAALARAAQADQELRAARRQWIPQLNIVAGIRASMSVDGHGVGYVVGVGGDLPLLDRGSAQAARARATARRWRAEATALASDAHAESERARRDLLLRIEQAEVYLAGPAVRAVDLLRRAASAHREGDRHILELIDTARLARQVAVRSLELIYEARRAELALERALGGPP